MGAAAESGADQIIITSDNPRNEEPAVIVEGIRRGLQRGAARIELDRARAIDMALATAGPRDVVLVAGKGHEDYQEVCGVRRPFSDQAQARQALATRAAGPGGVA